MIIQTLNEIITQSARRFPDKAAIEYNSEKITYKQLDLWSNRLGNLLKQNGFKSKETALVCMEKSIESIVSFIGVLKMGGSYIPVDDQYSPMQRIVAIIKHSKTQFIITNVDNWKKLYESIKKENDIKNLKVIFIDGVFAGKRIRDSYDGRNEKMTFYFLTDKISDKLMEIERIEKSDLAYVLYTSGSTGIPKGVMITHQNAASFINWAKDCFNPIEKDVFSSHAPFHFDLSVFDIYVSLLCGATLKLVPFEVTKNPRALIKWIEKSEITFWYSVPTVWTSILNYAKIDPEKFTKIKNILFAGETFPPKYLKKLMEILPNPSYYNLYGPTETNVCTYYKIPSIDAINGQSPPIGKACSNSKIYVLDDDLSPVDIGGVGELHVLGDTVTPGYYKNEEKTKKVFVKSPFLKDVDALLYKTGDVVKRIDSENFLYIGRKDLMVKYLGFRVEIQEIEEKLLQHDKVEEAVVVPLIEKDKSVTSLIGYIKLFESRSNDSILKIKGYLAESLPVYMIPEKLLIMEDIPKNANGKIDRQKIASIARKI